MADQYEKFLMGQMSARRLCQVEGFEDCANHLVPVLWGLQNAHDKAVYREAARLLRGIVRGLREGKVSRSKAHELFGLDAKALEELLDMLEGAKPHLKGSPGDSNPPRQ